MRRIWGREVAALLVLLYLLIPRAQAADSWSKIRYQAGSVHARVNPFDWNTTLKVSPAAIEITFEASGKIIIPNRKVTALTCGDTAYHRFADMLLNPSSSPVPLFGLVRKSKDHLIGIEFTNADGTPGAVLLLVHKNGYDDLLHALTTLTALPANGNP